MQPGSYRFQLLAPPGITLLNSSISLRADSKSYRRYVNSLQQLRARAYLADGAIRPDQLESDGGFRMRQDERCWHCLLVDSDENVVGCVRYLAHPSTVCVNDLWLSRSPLASHPEWGSKFLASLESNLALVRDKQLTFVEIGGWAIDNAYRHTKAALEILLASFAWTRMIGGGIGACTATVRNNSAAILRRVGGTSLEYGSQQIPPYEDASYGCVMEVLRFHFQEYDLRYQKMVDSIYGRLTEQTTVTPSSIEEECIADSLNTMRNLGALQKALRNADAGRPIPVIEPGVPLSERIAHFKK